MGGKGSGRYAYTFSAKEARNKLGSLTPAALRNIKRSIEVENNVDNSKWLMQILIPKQLSPEDTANAMTTLADFAKLAMKGKEDAPVSDEPVHHSYISAEPLRNITPDECNGVCDSQAITSPVSEETESGGTPDSGNRITFSGGGCRYT